MKKYESENPRQSKNIIVSSIIASLVSNTFTIPFGVLGIRQQKEATLFKQFKTANLIKFKYNSMLSTLKYIVQTNGFFTLFNGLKFSLMQNIIYNISMFITYEQSKSFLSKFISNSLWVYTSASIISTLFSSTISFPFEYWKTLAWAYDGQCKQSGLQLGQNIFSAYLLTMSRNLLFFGLYWPIAEYVKNYIMTMKFYYSDKLICILCTHFLSGTVASLCAAAVTQPLDIVKTRKQVFNQFKGQGAIKIMKQIYLQEGIDAFFVGLVPRFCGITLYWALMLSLYEFFLSFNIVKFNKQNIV